METRIKLSINKKESISALNHPKYGYLLSTLEVAKGYGLSREGLNKVFTRNPLDFQENTHYVKGGTICPTLPNANIQPHATYWTKAGVIRFGFFVKTARGVAFRDLAEKILISGIDENQQKKISLPAAHKTKANRLTEKRLIDLLTLCSEIEDNDLRIKMRNAILNK
jgi:hypothetical protein